MGKCRFAGLIAFALLSVIVDQARAQPQPLVFSVPGLINAGNLGTYVLCSSTDAATQIVSMEVFETSGASAGFGVFGLAAKASVMFGTRLANGVSLNVVVGNNATITVGLAEIGSTSKNLICSAFVADAVGTTPDSMATLTVTKKDKQKGD